MCVNSNDNIEIEMNADRTGPGFFFLLFVLFINGMREIGERVLDFFLFLK